MVRLTRAQQQERTRAAVLAAAEEEFTEHGYALAKVDRIAERAELTRGAVYSNFPSKRALYLAVLISLVESAAVAEPPNAPASLPDALGSFARVWLERLPLAGETAGGGRLQLRSLVGVLDDDHGRAVLAQAARLEATLLGLALESCAPARRVRLASLVLTLLDGAGYGAETAPGSGDPFDLALACRHLAGMDLADTWAPPHLSYVEPARSCAEGWDPPAALVDRISGSEVDLGADGVVVVLGARRLAAAEEAVRSARQGERVTVVVVTGDPAETGRLVRLRVSDLTASLRRVFAADPLPCLRLVIDDDAAVASALGLADAGDETEAAVRVQDGTVVARAAGRGAGHAAAIVSRRRKAGR
ncbi:transcriptional regulator, TetR family [Lentzea xinjiangensis]|uniref:Transcriptional regulator, TetR family n=1 Tax=Lentzea xinjiangensis TaxID=402600 RepID=A0A1H9UG57_9PSEU|nr:TetR/AcrR family transcriptional regulator [Lentzea xinjiangensis]SES08520.1 transcriptional regulator, TetR family [Lentzea xinjiangensis]